MPWQFPGSKRWKKEKSTSTTTRSPHFGRKRQQETTDLQQLPPPKDELADDTATSSTIISSSSGSSSSSSGGQLSPSSSVASNNQKNMEDNTNSRSSTTTTIISSTSSSSIHRSSSRGRNTAVSLEENPMLSEKQINRAERQRKTHVVSKHDRHQAVVQSDNTVSTASTGTNSGPNSLGSGSGWRLTSARYDAKSGKNETTNRLNSNRQRTVAGGFKQIFRPKRRSGGRNSDNSTSSCSLSPTHPKKNDGKEPSSSSAASTRNNNEQHSPARFVVPERLSRLREESRSPSAKKSAASRGKQFLFKNAPATISSSFTSATATTIGSSLHSNNNNKIRTLFSTSAWRNRTKKNRMIQMRPMDTTSRDPAPLQEEPSPGISSDLDDRSGASEKEDDNADRKVEDEDEEDKVGNLYERKKMEPKESNSEPAVSVPCSFTQTTSLSNSTRSLLRSKVRFFAINIYEHPTIVGVEPLLDGPALTLGWKMAKHWTTNVNEYRQIRQRAKFKSRRYNPAKKEESPCGSSSSSMVPNCAIFSQSFRALPPKERFERLIQNGIPSNEINEAMLTAQLVVQQRLETEMNDTITMLAAGREKSFGNDILSKEETAFSDGRDNNAAATAITIPPESVMILPMSPAPPVPTTLQIPLILPSSPPFEEKGSADARRPAFSEQLKLICESVLIRDDSDAVISWTEDLETSPMLATPRRSVFTNSAMTISPTNSLVSFSDSSTGSVQFSQLPPILPQLPDSMAHESPNYHGLKYLRYELSMNSVISPKPSD